MRLFPKDSALYTPYKMGEIVPNTSQYFTICFSQIFNILRIYRVKVGYVADLERGIGEVSNYSNFLFWQGTMGNYWELSPA